MRLLLTALLLITSFSVVAQRVEGYRPEPAILEASEAIEGYKPIPTEFEIFGMPVNWHAQTTYINQRYPNFNAQYSGPNSLKNNHALSYTWSGTLFLGARIAPNTDIYFNPEVFSGVPFSGLVGLGGLSNGEANKAAGSQAKFYSARAFLRSTINQESDEDDDSVADDANDEEGRNDDAGDDEVSPLADPNDDERGGRQRLRGRRLRPPWPTDSRLGGHDGRDR